MKFFNDYVIKAVLAILAVGGLTTGFFMKLVSPEIFVGVVTSIITHYFNADQVNKLNDALATKTIELQSLRDHKVEVVDLDAKEKNV